MEQHARRQEAIARSRNKAVKELVQLRDNPNRARGDSLLDDAARDLDNLEHRLKHSVMELRPSGIAAAMFVKDCLDACLKRLGIMVSPTMDPRMIDRQLEGRRVKVERRHPSMYPDSEKWKGGLYIYKDNEIVDFIGEPVYSPLSRMFMIRTTVGATAPKLYSH